jgi:hypothetical protein
MVIFWIGLQLTQPTDLPINLIYSFAIPLLAFLGGIFGIIISNHWGRFKSAVGKGTFFLAAGTALWGASGFLWTFYNFVLHQEVPYPSLADVGFVGAIPLWVMGIIFLSKATGARLSLRRVGGRLFLVLLPIAIAFVSYYVLFVVARDSSFDWQGGYLKIFLDLFYPIGDFVILTLSVIVWGLSSQYLGGRYRWPIFATLFGFVIMYIADFSFSYTTTLGTYFNGNISDLFFTTALFLISFGVASMDGRDS